MTKRMLIDASHPEETRVVVVDGSRVEEFDFEAAFRRPLKGNIYLAKVTRVEPSLQAAFVEYGGNRQGFLAFSEIHPDYYQIPAADRQALIAEREAEARRRQEDDIETFDIGVKAKGDAGEEEEDDEAGVEEEAPIDDEEREISGEALVASAVPQGEVEDGEPEEADAEHDHEDVFVNHAGAVVEEEDETKSQAAHAHLVDYDHDSDVVQAEAAMENESEIEPISTEADEDGEGAEENAEENAEDNEGALEPVSGEAQPLNAARPPQKWVRKKHYKIQEVIKRRQIILVQVVKEERGNKGAALTTYLSLAGRYCVLMPNTPRGGGISRKITNAVDRKRLKSAVQGLELPEGMGLIIRTAGENRTKIDIRRDYEYLLRLWDTVREKTLGSNAPACVYEEGDLIKRAIRDLYTKDVSDVVVEGEGGYRNAKDFMRMLMPSHARNVVQYKDTVPLYQRMHIEAQLDSMFSPTVTLKSGGYIVINQTEALVSIDVNSGRATREHSIEETARKTNLEAASEVGRQLRLRDLAGLIVIDFIDMEESRNDREVEKRLRDAVKNDRARVQIGKISQFGLMEMSRQRLRAGVVASSTMPCPHCGGVGLVRSVESSALRLLRALEEEGEKNRAAAVTVKTAGETAIYILNQKRHELDRIETEHGMTIGFVPQNDMAAGAFEIDRTKTRDPSERPRSHAVGIEAGFVAPDEIEPEIVEEEDEIEEEEEGEAVAETTSEDATTEERPRETRERDGRKRRRRGGRGRGRDAPRTEASPEANGEQQTAPAPADEPIEEGEESAPQGEGQAGEGGEPRRRRRRRRGRRGGRDREAGAPEGQQPAENNDAQAPKPSFAPVADRFGSAPDEIDTTPSEDRHAPGTPSTPVWTLTDDEPDTTPGNDSKPVKKGWWQRTFSSGDE